MIALFVHDRIVRPYIGDMLVVVVIYTFLRIWIPDSVRMLPFYVFLFATVVEILQYFNLVELLGVQDNVFLRILLGTSFDVKDILCYAAGCILIWIVEPIKRVYVEMVKQVVEREAKSDEDTE